MRHHVQWADTEYNHTLADTYVQINVGFVIVNARVCGE